MKIVKIVCLFLVVVVCFAFSSVLCSAWVYNYDFDYDTAYYSPMPFDVSWERSNGNSYYYGLPNNVLGFDYDVYSDSNLKYLISNDTLEYTPFGEFNPRNTTSVIYQRIFRYAVSRADFGGSISLMSGYYDNPMYLRLLPIPITLDTDGLTPVGELDVYIGYRYYDESLNEYIYDEYGFTGTVEYTSSYRYEDNILVYSYNLYEYLANALPVNIDSLYIFDLNFNVDNDHNGFGYVTYMGYETYHYPFYDMSAGVKPLLPRVDISGYISDFADSFRQLLSIELLPGLAIYNIVALAVVVPVGLALIRKV